MRSSTTLTQFTKVIQRTSTKSTYDKGLSTRIVSIPADFFPTAVTTTDIDVCASHHKQNIVLHNSTPVTAPSNIQQAIEQAPLWQRYLLQHFHVPDPDYLTQCLVDPECRVTMVSDGGMIDGKGSFGVVVGTPTDILYSIEGPALGNSEHMHAYRSEGYGMMASFNFLHLFLITHQILLPPNREIKVFCDNLSLVNIINEILCDGIYPRLFVKPEADIISQILVDIKALKQLHVSINVEHVRGHQDDHTKYALLPRPAQLKVEADTHATNYLFQGPQYPYAAISSNPINMYINDDIITKSYKTSMRIASRSPCLRVYLISFLSFDGRHRHQI